MFDCGFEEEEKSEGLLNSNTAGAGFAIGSAGIKSITGLLSACPYSSYSLSNFDLLFFYCSGTAVVTSVKRPSFSVALLVIRISSLLMFLTVNFCWSSTGARDKGGTSGTFTI